MSLVWEYPYVEECDCCHEWLPVLEVQLAGSQFLCEKCRTAVDNAPKPDTISNQKNLT